MTLTVPTEDVRHTVTDEQLDALCRGGKDMSLEWCLLFLGAGFGFLQNLAAVAAGLIKGSQSPASDVVFAMLCVGCFVGAAAKYSEHRKRDGDIDKLKRRIIDGKRVRVK